MDRNFVYMLIVVMIVFFSGVYICAKYTSDRHKLWLTKCNQAGGVELSKHNYPYICVDPKIIINVQ